MNRLVADLTFFILTFVVVMTLLSYNPRFDGFGDTGGAATGILEKRLVPNMELISPNRDSTIYTPQQTFLYKVYSVDYNVDCSLIINGDSLGKVETVSVEQLAEFKTELPNGFYKWRIQCKLLNGRTISSEERKLKIEPFQNIEGPTGRVVSAPKQYPIHKQVMAIILVVLGAFVWVLNIHRNPLK